MNFLCFGSFNKYIYLGELEWEHIECMKIKIDFCYQMRLRYDIWKLIFEDRLKRKISLILL